MQSKINIDWWLWGICLARTFNGLVFMTYAATLPVLQQEWGMSAAAAGSIAGVFQFGYALSLMLSGAAIPVGGYRLAFWVTCAGPAAGAVLAWLTLRRTIVGRPVRTTGQHFSREVLRNRPVMALIGGYTGHSWELLGMWAWTPAFLAVVFVTAGYEGIQAAGIGAYLAAGFHMTGLVASFSMGWLSDRLGRAPLLVGLAGISTLCSFSFGWTLGLPLSFVFLVGMVYSFSGLGDSPILSTSLTESVSVSYMGAAFGLRSMLGFGAGAISPVALGAILDMTNPGVVESGVYTNWGWAFSILGIGGLGAWLAALYYSRMQKGRIP